MAARKLFILIIKIYADGFKLHVKKHFIRFKFDKFSTLKFELFFRNSTNTC